MRATILVAAMVIRWAILKSVNADPRWSSGLAITWMVVIAVALAWDIYDSYQQARQQRSDG